MDLTAFVTVLTTVFSIGVKVVGMPSQIKENHRRKSTVGLSSWFMITTLASYILWVVHGIQVHDMALVIGQGLGTAVTAVIVIQMLVYQRARPDKEKPEKRPRLLWFTVMQTAVFHKNSDAQSVPTATSLRSGS